MKTKTAFFMFIFGLILAMLGLGGVENSVTNPELIVAMLVTGVGILIMYAGTLGIRTGGYYDR
jgi:hypothetical protein